MSQFKLYTNSYKNKDFVKPSDHKLKELVEKASSYITKSGTTFGSGLADHQIITVLHTLHSNKKPDIHFLNQVADLIKSNKI